MAFLRKFLRQLGGPPKEDDTLDDDLRKVLKRLPADTKRDLLEEYGSLGGSAKGLEPERPQLVARNATAPAFSPILEDEEPTEMTAADYAKILISVEDLPDLWVVRSLRKTLRSADDEWIAEFRDSNGIAGIYKSMAALAESRDTYLEEGDDDNEHEVPEEEVVLEQELVQCIMIVLNKRDGLITLEASVDLLPLLAGCAMDSTNSYVRSNLVKLLTIMTESGTSGFESVMNALDHQKVEKDEPLRFRRLIEAFSNADGSGVALVTDLMVFFNTIISSAFEFEERVHLRTEMITVGIIEAMDRIRDYYGLSPKEDDSTYAESDDGRVASGSGSLNSDSISALMLDAAVTAETQDLAAQLDLFDSVMEEDRRDALAAGGSPDEGDESDDANPINLQTIEEEGKMQDAASPMEYPPDSPAVCSIRVAMEKITEEEAQHMLVVITEKLERMATADCDVKHWKKICNYLDSMFEATVMMGGDDDDEDDYDDHLQALLSKSTDAPPSPPASVPPPASRNPPPGQIPVTGRGTSRTEHSESEDTSVAPIPPPTRPGTNANTSSAAPNVTAGAIPRPPQLPGMSPAPIPAAPPLPGMPSAPIPAAPPLPGMPSTPIPAAPPLPGMSSAPIPAAPPLPGMPSAPIPAAPPLPGMSTAAIPAAPPLPGMFSVPIPAAPPLPGRSSAAIPAAPPLPGRPSAPIPAAPPLPGRSSAAIPAAPPLPGISTAAIPAAPPLPGMSTAAIPAAPPLPGMSSVPIPAAPPLPGMPGKSVPLPPPLPGMPGKAVPLPPPLPGVLGRGIPAAPALPGGGAAPMAPPLPGLRALPLPPLRPLAPPALKKPAQKRRPVHWDKIPPVQVERTIFAEINPDSVKLPMELLEMSFVEKKEKASESGGQNKPAPKAKPKVEKVSLLDGKILQNNGIVLKRFGKKKPQELVDALVAMDLDQFDTEKLFALRGICASPDDLPKLKGYEGDLAKLDEVTLFMVLTAKIPRYQQRLDCALFIKAFEGDADFLSDKLKLVDIARLEVFESTRLKRLLEVVLAYGNYLNEGTRNGNAQGIKLSSLLRLDTVKTMDKKRTLLHVLLDWAKTAEQDLMELDQDLVHANEASQWGLTDLKNQVTQISKGFTLMRNQLKIAEGSPSSIEGDGFVSMVKPFLERATTRMESLEVQYETVQKDYDNTALRFGEDPTKMPSADFFALITTLLDKIAVATKENDTAVKNEERRKKREEQERKRKEAQEQRREAREKRKLESRLSSRPGIGRGGLSSTTSIRPSQRDTFRRKSRREIPFRPEPRFSGSGRASAAGGNVEFVEKMLGRRRMLATEDDDSDDEEDWDPDNDAGEISRRYNEIKGDRAAEGAILKNMSALHDPSQRDVVRRQLPYQKSTLGRESSVTRMKSTVASGSPAIMRQLAAVRQASNLRQMAALRQASTARRSGSRTPSIIRPSGAGGGIDGRGGSSTGRIESRRFPGASPMLTRRQVSADDDSAVSKASNRRRQLKTLRSVAFLVK